MMLRSALLSLLTLFALNASAATPSVERPVDMLVIAPHPDDEALCCAGVIANAVAHGQRVHVLVMTNGGAWALAASALAGKPEAQLGALDFMALAHARRAESLAGMQQLGLPRSDVTLLAYPDELADAYDASNPTSPHRAMLVSALARVIAELHPREVFAPGLAESHPTHLATARFTRDALAAAHWHGHFLTYVIHSGSYLQWPWPQAMTPTSGFEAHEVDGARVPSDVSWPPPVRVQLSSELVNLKLASIQKYTTQMVVSAPFLESFVKDEEIFWNEEL